MARFQNALEVIKLIKSDHRVFVHGGASTPNVLLKALVQDASRLRNVEIMHLHTEGDAEYASKDYSNNFRVVNLFGGHNVRNSLNCDRVDYLPCFLSEIPKLFLSQKRHINVAMLHLSPPDQHGFCTLGTSVDVASAAAKSADIVIAQINTQMPRIHGDGFIHINDLDAYLEVSEPLPEAQHHKPTEAETKIGGLVSEIVEDGSCIQVGIGTIPNAVLNALRNHKNLGVHSEMWSDGVLSLIQSGVVDNSKKLVHRGKTVSGFIVGSKAVYDFINDNPSVIQLGIDYVNNPSVIARNPKVVAINSAVEIDLTGQVCADSIGHKIISGVGGQVDFIRGAALSKGGKPIIAMTSRSKKSKSKIVAELTAGAGVVTTRSHIQYVVTEYGIADLSGKTLGERANAMIALAHPEERESLEKQWFKIRNH